MFKQPCRGYAVYSTLGAQSSLVLSCLAVDFNYLLRSALRASVGSPSDSLGSGLLALVFCSSVLSLWRLSRAGCSITGHHSTADL